MEEELDCSWRGIFFIESGPLLLRIFGQPIQFGIRGLVILAMASSASMGSYEVNALRLESFMADTGLLHRPQNRGQVP